MIPIGGFGLFGYAMLALAWLVWLVGKDETKKFAALAFLAMSVFGVIFSIYLTFLEPFVIGASCAWCLSSALIMMILLWAALPLALPFKSVEEKEVE